MHGAQITAVETATNIALKVVTSSAGEFAFTNLPLGNYTVAVSGTGFATVKMNKVTVSAGVSYTLVVKLAVAAAAQSVEVTASALALDTVNLSTGREKRYPFGGSGKSGS